MFYGQTYHYWSPLFIQKCTMNIHPFLKGSTLVLSIAALLPWSLMLCNGFIHTLSINEGNGYSSVAAWVFECVRTLFDLRIVCLASLHFWQTKVSGTLDRRILAQDRWIQVKHSEHSIIGRPKWNTTKTTQIREQTKTTYKYILN